MATQRQLKVYQLYKGPKGPTCQSIHYGVHSKKVWMVAAVSVKQAYYLAGNDVWREDGQGTGIVEMSTDAANEQWRYDDGKRGWHPKHKHGQKLPE